MDAPGGERRTSSWTRLDTIALGVIVAIGGVLRAIGLTRPAAEVFDEPSYARDACWYVRPGDPVCGTPGEGNLEHPPLGKWLIAAGEAVFGHTPLGWRVASLVAGVIGIALTYVLARKLLSSTVAASLAAGLLAIDFLHFVHSRLAMLDIFHGLFVLAAFTSLAFDRDALLAGHSGIKQRPWRLVAGAAAACATATKWSGIFTLVGLLVIELAWEISRRKPIRRLKALGQLLRTDGIALGVSFVIVPIAVYLFTYVGRVQGDVLALPWADGSWFAGLAERHQEAFRFHRDNEITNPYASPPWTWLLLKRAFPYLFQKTDDGMYQQLLAGGSPLVWWLSIPALLVTTLIWFKRNRPERPEGLLLGGFYWNFLPWVGFAFAPFLLGSNRSSIFIFYVVPLLPFMFIAMAHLAQRALKSVWGKGFVGAFAVAAIALFVFYWPFLTARPLEPDAWRSRIWVFNDCGRDHAPIVINDIKTRDGTVTTRVIEKGKEFLPPEGWCWVQVRQGLSKIGLDRFITPSPSPSP